MHTGLGREVDVELEDIVLVISSVFLVSLCAGGPGDKPGPAQLLLLLAVWGLPALAQVLPAAQV